MNHPTLPNQTTLSNRIIRYAPTNEKRAVSRSAHPATATSHFALCEILGNDVPMAVLRTSGNVVTMDCVEKMIKRFMVDPTNGFLMSESDIIPLQRGGNGFSTRNEMLMLDQL
ncbi:hypothetical protein TNCT_544281 [Trichonephila clavata]|uniref:Uncharacterized protein n=1 Tax=Trichonephila clavata TaxID=2740835 RepID=A0A8X6LCB3_TRICU|nr:hypothetical protein TNCT_544281 [Trichonephila clavata]